MIQPSYPLRTARLDLRPFTDDDFAALHAIHGDADVVRYLYWEPFDEEATRVALARKARRTTLIDSGDALALAAVVRDSGQVAGDCMFRWTSAENHQGEIGYVFAPRFHGHGYATEAAEELLRFGFSDVGAHRIIGSLNGRNTASARLLERLGMRKEAHLRHSEMVKGEWADEVVFAILADEWAAARGRHPPAHTAR